MSESQEIVGDLCLELRKLLEVACTDVMAQFEGIQLPNHRVEFAIVAYMLDGEEAITLSATGAPWMIITQALQQAAKTPQLVSGPPRLQ